MSRAGKSGKGREREREKKKEGKEHIRKIERERWVEKRKKNAVIPGSGRKKRPIRH